MEEKQRDVVICSESLFPDLFVVDDAMEKNLPGGGVGGGGVAGSASGALAAAAAAAAAAAGTGADDEHDGMEDDAAQQPLDATATCSDATIADMQVGITKQVEVNMALFKQRLFALLKLNHTTAEEKAAYEAVQALEQSLDENPVVSSMAWKISKNGSIVYTKMGGTLGLTPQQKVTLRTLQTIDSVFRFNLEEVALRWSAKQDRPFNLKTYHDVASAQIELRQQARHAYGVSEATVRQQQRTIDDITRRLSVHDEAHTEHMKLYLQELQLLRAQILDMQRRLKVQEDIPQLVGKAEAEGPAMYQVAHDKHMEFINRRLTEECALLVHTLEQRNQVVKALQVELTQTKQAAGVVRDEFRKYISEQEKLDVEFRSQYAQNETAMHQAIANFQAELDKNRVLTQSNKRLSDQVNNLHLEVDALKADLHETQSELAQVKRQHAMQLDENRSLRVMLEETRTNMARQKEAYERQLEAAQRRIEELERNDIKAKLEAALQRIVQLDKEVADLKQTIVAEKARFAAEVEQNKKTVRDFEKKIQKMEEARELAEKRRIEALEVERKRWKDIADKRVQAVEQEKLEQGLAFQHQLDGAEKFQEELVHEILLGHRQTTIMERFLANGMLGKEALRELAKALMATDISFHADDGGAGLRSPDADAESIRTTSSSKKSLQQHHGGGATLAVADPPTQPHTPRTVEYFTYHRQFEPTEMQQRITVANDALNAMVLQQDPAAQHAKGGEAGGGGAVVVLPSLRAHLGKSTVTLDFLHGIKDRLMSRVLPGGSGGGAAGGDGRSGESSMTDDPLSASASVKMRLESSMRQQVSLAPPWECGVESSAFEFSPNSTSNNNNTTVSSVAAFAATGVEEPGNAQSPLGHSSSIRRSGSVSSGVYGRGPALAMRQQMVLEELKSQVIGLKIREEALIEEIHKHQDDMFSGGGGVRTRPSSGEMSSRPQSGKQRSFAALGQSVRNAASLRRFGGNGGAMGGGGGGSGMIPHEESLYGGEDEDGNGAGGREELPVSFLDFPGIENAVEYLDMFDSFEKMRLQLRQLVEICAMDVQRGALDPHDLERAKELLHAKFTCFRAVESHASDVLHRLHRKKEDIMRRREEELEKVLGAMQNLSLTHPAEAKQLVKAARVARQQQGTSLLRQSGGGGIGGAADASNTSMTAVVERPHSSMSAGSHSMRKLTVAPRDVIVSGAAALMTLRGAQQRIGSAKPVNHSK